MYFAKLFDPALNRKSSSIVLLDPESTTRGLDFSNLLCSILLY